MATPTAKVLELVSSIDALAVLVAALRAEEEGLVLPAEIAERIAAIVEMLGVEPASADDRRAAIGAARSFSRLAMDLMDAPARAPGWTSTDPVILESTGRASSTIADAIAEAIPAVPGLEAATSAPEAALLDVGTGVAQLSITMCRRFATLRALGVDIFEPALALGRENVARSGLGGRIELRQTDARALDERETFSLAWIPVPFLADTVLDDVLGTAVRALRPGGLVVAGVFRAPPSPLAAKLAELRMLRAGGTVLDTRGVIERLERAGLVDARAPELASSTARLVFATKPVS